MLARTNALRIASKMGLLLALIGIASYSFTSKYFMTNADSLYKMYHSAASHISSFGIRSKAYSMSLDQRRRLAKTILDIEIEISNAIRKKSLARSHWSVKLKSIARELDARVPGNTWDYSARLPDMEPVYQSPKIKRHVCPEVYSGSRDTPYNQHGMAPENCTYVPKLNSVLTAVLPAFTWETGVTDFVIEQIRKYYDIPIIALVTEEEKVSMSSENVTVLEVTKDYDEGGILNKAIERVETPFVFLGLSLTHFSSHFSFERLIRILDELEDVHVAGGAARDLKGQWQYGCLQQRMAVYQAKYITGYHYSKYECMYCDDLLTPFVTYKTLLKDIPFTDGLSSPALYRDWFARVKLRGHLTMSCPDVMFFVNSHVSMNRESWHLLAKKFLLEKIFSFDGEVYEFDCLSIGIFCQNIINAIRQILLPHCCRGIVEKSLGFMRDFGERNNLSLELFEGSTLAAVKMGGHLPWDFDVDLVVNCRDYPKWFNGDYELKPICHFFEHSPNRYFTIKCSVFFLEIFCYSYNLTSQQFLPKEYQNISTTIKFAGRNIGISANPGLYVRNMYGLELLKHAGHWRTLKPASKMGKMKGGYDNTGTWSPCEDSTFHSCLDHYPADGNLPFLEPFLNP